VDAIAIIEGVVFVIEFKVGEQVYHRSDLDQVWDYALDLKNFHEPSHQAILVPVLVATEAHDLPIEMVNPSHGDNLFVPLRVNKFGLKQAISDTLDFIYQKQTLDPNVFSSGRYAPTPTIIEAALALFQHHTVADITRSDAEAQNLTKTTTIIDDLVARAKSEQKKIICFVTGVPGAGKTLVGLNVATTNAQKESGNTSIYLSGNGPLVDILQEALARDKIKNEREKGLRLTKREAKASVKAFIQNIHHYRDEYLRDASAPFDHIAIFDEAQRAWNKEQTVKFMTQKKDQKDFDYSEPEFLISCLDRHQDWAVIVCLVGGGQEINTGEAGIAEWLSAVKDRFPQWEVYISPNLTDSEYAAATTIDRLQEVTKVHLHPDLHLNVSMRSFRAENVSFFVKCLLDLEAGLASDIFSKLKDKYPILLTRDLGKAKAWLKKKARGSERYGIVASSQAQRLKPFAIDVKSPMNPIYWFLNSKEDVRSSYYLEDVATEFHVQGLELDWVCVTWDGDLRFDEEGWKTYAFKGKKWQNIHQKDRKKYLINAYRVLLTRARQGMVIVVPEGNPEDHTRLPEFYDPNFQYLQSLGIPMLEG
jgi:DUF2075 family protein